MLEVALVGVLAMSACSKREPSEIHVPDTESVQQPSGAKRYAILSNLRRDTLRVLTKRLLGDRAYLTEVPGSGTVRVTDPGFQGTLTSVFPERHFQDSSESWEVGAPFQK
jgi:hypothetical protein